LDIPIKDILPAGSKDIIISLQENSEKNFTSKNKNTIASLIHPEKQSHNYCLFYNFYAAEKHFSYNPGVQE
jgi:hypothetical protein